MATSESMKAQMAKKRESNTNNQTADQQEAAAPAQRAASPREAVQKMLDTMKPEIEKALPKHIDSERMVRIAMSVVSSNPEIMNVITGSQGGKMSFLGAVMSSAQLGLEPNTAMGEAYIIPYKTKNGPMVQMQVSYKGILTLATRSGQYKAIYAHEVYEEDEFNFRYGLHKDLVHIPSEDASGEPIGYYACYHLINGGYDFVYWTRDKVDAHAKRFSKAHAKGWSSPWKSDFDAMAKKTVLKDLLKYAPKSIEVNKMLSSDETIKTELRKDMTEVFDATDDVEVLNDIDKNK